MLYFVSTSICFNYFLQDNAKRTYLVQINGEYKGIEITMRVVDWLTKMNTNYRADKTFDKAFIKALLIAVLSVKLVKSGEEIDDGYISFVKGEFLV